MKTELIIAARRKAEDAVADMPEGDLKVKAFEIIFQSLLTVSPANSAAVATRDPAAEAPNVPKSLAGRVALLAEEEFFAEPRSLAEIQSGLAAHGWHYPTNNLSTPLVRLVRNRKLRRLQLTIGRTRIWKYALP